MSRIAVLFLSLSIASAVSAEKLHVLALSSQPFFYDDDGTPAGIEYEILTYFAKTRNLEIVVEYVDAFPDLLERIAQGEADIAAGTITITPERQETVDFSAPYFPVQVVLVERTGETSTSLDDPCGLTGRRVRGNDGRGSAVRNRGRGSGSAHRHSGPALRGSER